MLQQWFQNRIRTKTSFWEHETDESLLPLVYHIFLQEESFPLYPLHPPRLSQPQGYTVIHKLRYLEKQ